MLQPAPSPWTASLTPWLGHLPSGNTLDQLAWAVLWVAQAICQAGLSPLARWSSSLIRARLEIPRSPLHNAAGAGSSEEALPSCPLSRHTATCWLTEALAALLLRRLRTASSNEGPREALCFQATRMLRARVVPSLPVLAWEEGWPSGHWEQAEIHLYTRSRKPQAALLIPFLKISKTSEPPLIMGRATPSQHSWWSKPLPSEAAQSRPHFKSLFHSHLFLGWGEWWKEMTREEKKPKPKTLSWLA